MLKTRSRW